MSSIYGTYKGWYLPGFESDESLEHKKIEQQMDETETSTSNEEACAFRYTGQTVNKAFVGKVTQLLVGNGIPNFLFGDMMFRFFGCETDVLSINLSIPDELMDEAARVLRQAGFYDGPVEPFEVEEAQCVQEFQTRQDQQPFLAWGCRYLDDHEYHRSFGAWWLPTHVFHLNQTPGKLGHVDLSLFTHSHYFWDLPAPTLAPDEDAQSSYVLSKDRRLPEPVCFGPGRHAVKMILPACLVEALILLAYRDIHVPSQITFSDWHDDLFVIFKMVSGWEWPEDDPTFDGYSQFTKADPHGWQFSLDGQRLRMRSKVTGLDPRWLRLAAFQPLFQKYFEDLFETVHLPRESYLRTPSPENTLSEEEQRKEFAEWDKLIENEEELAEWEKRIQ
ncbi:uncharacterized protein BO95DRAFT_498546 [Aspergillus brunneoviolaceus CBS 621.78]|uniref:Uncharacterized protein n=1 Tax=Aspergillus brunneoviolaceus CBS 621.78 TaxID=1450534 RepID=A0ACD1G6Q8_9EURO|nr:hypothetical protein BO95DRAFT_498546 [Aspergillus brunneoviolaceus CBS 621.78]RAH44940.1 hypothetical protein BO95DRAFT_498546 [Aspergillus brunneoviolaceus CBS 621.78]